MHNPQPLWQSRLLMGFLLLTVITRDSCSSWAFISPSYTSKLGNAWRRRRLDNDLIEPNQRCTRSAPGFALATANNSNNNNNEKKKDSSNSKKKKKRSKKSSSNNAPKSQNRPSNNRNKPKQKTRKSKEETKKAVAKAAVALRQGKQKDSPSTDASNKDNLLDILDPFKAGKKLRQKLDTALTSLGASTQGLASDRRSVYYVEDRLNPSNEMAETALFSERNPLFDRMSENSLPEVLVVGAAGAVGRRVVQRLLLDGKCRVRVLVRDLYSKTLNLLGTGVTYCQGDLANLESLEYAVTDVDKIVFCASPPKPDEESFQEKFQEFVQETLEERSQDNVDAESDSTAQSGAQEWEQLESVLELRARLAEQVDYKGMQNLVRAYQNVRHADFGTSQAAKRSLFKFQDRPEDFNLFAIDEEQQPPQGTSSGTVDEQETEERGITQGTGASYDATSSNNNYDEYADYDDYDYENDSMDDYEEDDPYADYEDDYQDYDDKEDYTATATRKGATVKTQVQWIKNKFEHGVFVGKVPKEISGLGGEAAVVSSRLRSREEPDSGIDLSNGFAGFVCRICSDGGTYEAFVRSGNYETDGIEYVCEFRTSTKSQQQRGNKSKNKFKTIRLAFDSFQPIRRREGTDSSKDSEDEFQQTSAPPFKGRDVRQIGFRYRSERNREKSKLERGELSSFYLAISYIKVYRFQPEPEFVYLSDSRIPPHVSDSMVRHDLRQLVASSGASDGSDGASVSLLDDVAIKSATAKSGRSSEETYYKYRGEEILKNSGLSYTIVRVSGYNESPGGEASTIDLTSSNEYITAVSRDEVAQVCASALLDPSALNKSFYMTKTQRKSTGGDLSKEEDMSNKFSSLPTDAI